MSETNVKPSERIEELILEGGHNPDSDISKMYALIAYLDEQHERAVKHVESDERSKRPANSNPTGRLSEDEIYELLPPQPVESPSRRELAKSLHTAMQEGGK